MDLDALYSMLYDGQPGLEHTVRPTVDPEDLARQHSAIKNILEGKSVKESLEHNVPGTDRWFRTRFFPLYQDKRAADVVEDTYIDGVVAATVDITGT